METFMQSYSLPLAALHDSHRNPHKAVADRKRFWRITDSIKCSLKNSRLMMTITGVHKRAVASCPVLEEEVSVLSRSRPLPMSACLSLPVK